MCREEDVEICLSGTQAGAAECHALTVGGQQLSPTDSGLVPPMDQHQQQQQPIQQSSSLLDRSVDWINGNVIDSVADRMQRLAVSSLHDWNGNGSATEVTRADDSSGMSDKPIADDDKSIADDKS